MSKKLPPLNGGGEDSCGAETVDFICADVANTLAPEGLGGGGGDIGSFEPRKLSPPKASASPPKVCGDCAGVRLIEGC